MRRYSRAVALVVGLALLLIGAIEPPAFTQYGPPPPCSIISVTISGHSQGTTGEALKFHGEATTQYCSPSGYKWTLGSAPQGAATWSESGQEVTFRPNVAGDYVLKLEVSAQGSNGPPVTDSAQHNLTVSGQGSQPQPPSPQPPQPPQTSGIQELAVILGQGSDNQFHAFPAQQVISAGGLRLFLTSLDRSVTLVLRREGAQAGVATVLVEAGKLAIVEAEFSQGVYNILDQGTSAQLGQIEAR